MARNKYPGYCYCCGSYVPAGYGHFELHRIRWSTRRIKCVKCASVRIVHDTDPEVVHVRKQIEREAGRQ